MNDPHSGHLAEDRIQAYLDQQLSADDAERVRAHLDRCAFCRAEITAWQGVFAHLGTLPEMEPAPGFEARVMRVIAPRALEWQAIFAEMEQLEELSPSPGFADAVMSRVRSPGRAPARLPRAARILEWLRPKTWKGWTLVGGIAAAPAAALAVLAVTVFSSPLLTPSYLGAFLWWQVTGAAGSLFSATGGRLIQSQLLFQAWEALRGFVASPGLAAGGLLGFSVISMAALWVLYRNLISRPPSDRTHAHASA